MNMVLSGITAVVIPFLVQGLKKLQMPTQAAPWVALGTAVVVVAVAKAFTGATLDLPTVIGTIAQGLGVGAISVCGYDIWKVNQNPGL